MFFVTLCALPLSLSKTDDTDTTPPFTTPTGVELPWKRLGQACGRGNRTYGVCLTPRAACTASREVGNAAWAESVRECRCVHGTIAVDTQGSATCQTAPTDILPEEMWRSLPSNTRDATPVSLGGFALNGIDLGSKTVQLSLYPSASFLQPMPYDPANNTITLITTKPLPTENRVHSFHLRAELSYGDVTVTDVMEIFVNVTRAFPDVEPVRTAIVVSGTRKGSLVFDLTTALGSLQGLDLKLEHDDVNITLFELRGHLVWCYIDINLTTIRTSSDSVGRQVRLGITVQQTGARVLTLEVAVIANSYSKTIDELSAPLTSLAVFQSLAASFYVTLVPESFNADFLSFDGNSSAIRLKKQPDYEEPNQRQFLFTLSLVHKTNASVTTRIPGVVSVDDRNDEKPRFAQKQYSFTVQSGALPGAILGVLSVTDRDATPATLAYKITDSYYDRYFQIDGKSGILYAPGILDENVLNSTFTFPVTVSDGVNTGSDPANVTVKISKLQLNRSGKLSREMRATVAENQPAGTVVVNASQANYTGYQLVTSRNFFTIDALTGVITTLRPIDREDELTEENVTVIAYPEQQTCNFEIVANVSITIEDVNDNPPVFSKQETGYEARIPEHSGFGTPVITMEANDRDLGTNASLTFTLSGPGSQLFNLNSTTGLVTVANSSALDREQNNTLRLIVTATDGTGSSLPQSQRLSTSTNLTVKLSDINDNSPVFASSSYTVALTENGGPTQLVKDLTTEVTDRDEDVNAKIRYQLFEGSRGYFSLNATTGQLLTRQALDREQVPEFFLKIIVYDNGSPQLSASTTVTVSVIDDNDNSPVFQERNYLVTVDEGTNCSSATILTVNASDADIGQNKVLYYSISSDLLLINSDTGEIRCNVSGLDYETANQRDFTVAVTARDNGTQPRTGSASVRVMVRDLNDNSPQFLETGANGYEVSVPEASFATRNIPVYVVTVVDSDSGENGRVNLTLTSTSPAGRGQNLLRVDQKGVVRANDSSVVIPGIYSFLVTATDNGPGRNSNTSRLEVNVTSGGTSGITFTTKDFRFSINETNCTQQEPIDFLKYTSSNAALHPLFAIRQGNPLHVNSATGQLFCNGSLDREEKESYEFFAEVFANETPAVRDYALVTVTILDVNDNAPRAALGENSYVFELREDSRVGHSVVNISATDKDKDNIITFSLQNTDTPFIIRPTTGEIVVNKTLDRESVDSYTLTVIIRDSGIPPRSTPLRVNISLVDVNDNPPQFTAPSFTFYVAEDKKPLEDIGVSLTVSDRDSGVNGIDGLTSAVLNPDLCPFNQLNLVSGVIGLQLALSTSLDYENVSSYVCILEVKDHTGQSNSMSSTASVTIHITDVNDNPPKFASVITNVNISRAEPVDYVIIPALNVTDADSAPNNQVTFSFADSGYGTDYFDIDPQGQITVRKLLGDLDVPSVDLTVRVENTEAPHFSDTVQITVYISDNNTAPFFTDGEYRSNVTDDTKSQNPILQFKAFDFENSQRVDCNCSYTLGKVESEYRAAITGYFSIDTIAPDAYVKQLMTIDREVSGSWIQLVLVATDNGVPPKSTRVNLNITVVDRNDNAPKFPVKTNNIPVNKRQCVGSYTLNTSTATDEDIAPNNVIVYNVTQLKPEKPQMVQVNSSTGEVTLDMAVACITDTDIVFSVRAEDYAQPGQGDSLVVTVTFDRNPNPPKFVNDTYQTTIPVSAQVNTTLDLGTNFYAKDEDNDNVTYKIESGNYRDLLFMESQPRAIKLRYALDDNAPEILNLTVIAVDSGNFSPAHSKTGTTTVRVRIQTRDKTCYSPGDVGYLSSRAEQFQLYQGLFIALVVLLVIAVIASIVFLYKWRVSASDQQVAESSTGPSGQSRVSYDPLMDPSGQHSSDQSGSRAKGRSADASGLPPGLPRRPRDQYSTPGHSGEGGDGSDSAGYLTPSQGQPSGQMLRDTEGMPGDNQGQYLSLLAGGSSPYLTPSQESPGRRIQSGTYLTPTSGATTVGDVAPGRASGTYLHPMFQPQEVPRGRDETSVTLEPAALPPPLPHSSSYNLGYSVNYPPGLEEYRRSLDDDRWSPRTQRMNLSKQEPSTHDDNGPRDTGGDSALAAVFGDGRPAVRADLESPRSYRPTMLGRLGQDV